jgi:copper chaperone CopZ
MEYMIHVSNMKCEGCASAIEEALSKIEGIKEYRLDLTNRSIFVNTGSATIEAVSKALTEAGFRPDNITP